MGSPFQGIRMLATDLDGTLLSSRQRISEGNLNALLEAGRAGIIRVIATGRSLFSLSRVVSLPELPVDYIIFSTGTGILDLGTGKVIYQRGFTKEETARIAQTLLEHNVSFILQAAVPENHKFLYILNDPVPQDFHHRLELYRGYGEPLRDIRDLDGISQFLLILEHGMEEFAELQARLTGVHIVRTTSPIDHRTVWMEIFPPRVHKGSALEWLAWRLGIDSQQVVAAGNDYNDLEMLNFAGKAFITGNAPPDMRLAYDVICHHDEDALADLLRRLEQ